MSDQWFYARDNRQQGPVSFDDVRRLAAEGSLQPTDLVWTQSMTSWQPAGGVAGLFPAAHVPPPPVYAPPAGYSHPGVHPNHRGYANPVPPPGYPPPGMGQDAGTRWLLPVGRSGWAIAAGYFGLLSVVPIFAPIALVLSILAIADIRKHPDRHGMGRAIFGLVMGVLFTLLGLVMLVSISARRY